MNWRRYLGIGAIPKVIRKYVHKRDHEHCRLCGAHVNGNGQIHHIFTRNSHIPKYLDVPDVPKNHHPWNLILLCPECHVKIHNGMEINKEELIEANKKKKLTEEIIKWVEENELG